MSKLTVSTIENLVATDPVEFPVAPLIPNATAGVSNQRAANTAFVKQSMGSDSNALRVNSNRTLTISDSGGYFFANANNLVFTLPNPSVVPLGTKFRIAQGSSTSGGSIVAPGGVTIGNITDSTAGNSISLAQNTEYIITAVDASAYHLTRIAAPVFTQSLTANGWQRLPNGLILQWITGALDPANNTQPSQTLTYPIGFTSQVFAVFVSMEISAFSTVSDGSYQVIAGSTLTNVTVQRQFPNDLNDRQTRPVVFAIGI